MSTQVTATYVGTGVNANDIIITLLDTPLQSAAANLKFQSDQIANIYQWQVVSTAGAVFGEITYDGVNWFGPIAMQDLTSTTVQTYVTVTTVNKPAVFYGSVRGIRLKQSGATAATGQLFGWSYGQYG